MPEVHRSVGEQVEAELTGGGRLGAEHPVMSGGTSHVAEEARRKPLSKAPCKRAPTGSASMQHEAQEERRFEDHVNQGVRDDAWATSFSVRRGRGPQAPI